MDAELLSERYRNELDGVLSCYDRIVITGSLAELCYAKGMTRYLYAHDTRIFDYAQWAEPLRAEIRANAEAVAQAANLTIEYISKKNFRKEDRIQALLAVAAVSLGWCISSAPWNPVRPTGPGMTRKRVTPISSLTVASVCTTTSTSSMRSWGCAISVCRLGVRFACSSTATATPA